jgi:hypothetical protein
MSEEGHFGWLIEARRDSQLLLLRLYSFGYGVTNLEEHETAHRLYAHAVRTFSWCCFFRSGGRLF